MKKRRPIGNNNAVSGVIEALLLVALVAIILATIQLVYIPDIMKDKETEHMDEVEKQFSYLKSAIDIQCMSQEDVPITSPLTLGSKELPYFVTVRSFGQLDISNDSGEIYVDYSPILKLTSIKYQSSNFYCNNQIYDLEGGCLIKKEAGEEEVKAAPSINVDIDIASNKITISYNIPIIKEFKGVISKSGYKICQIRTNYSHSDLSWIPMQNVDSINITTKYPTAWYNLLVSLLEDNVDFEQGSGYVEIKKKNPGKTIDFKYKRHFIYAQIGPGFVTT